MREVEEKMKNILRGAVVLLITIAMVFSSLAVTADTSKKHFSAAFVSGNTTENQNINTIPRSHNMFHTGGPTLFLQSPSPSSGYWYAYTSDLNSPYRCFDNFWDVNEPICDIHWWGVVGYWTGTEWIPCECDNMIFEIVFYTDSDGEPGEPVCVYEDVIPLCTFYDNYDGWIGYEWSYVLDPCCELSKGWVSIAGVSHPDDCWFLWMNSPDGDLQCLQEGGTPEWKEDDLSFELTGKECNPSIDVEKYVLDKNGEWVDADTEAEAVDLPICEDVTFKIVIHNNGEVDLKDIKVNDKMHDSLKYKSGDPEPDDYYYEPPFHYMAWFFPGPLHPCETIEIYIVAHVEGPECSYDFNYVLVEAMGCGQRVTDEDYAWVHARKPYRDINTPLLNLLELLMNQFPILKTLFGL